MRIIAIFLIPMVLNQALAARIVTFDSIEYSPKESDLIDYGTLTLKQSKKINTFVLDGNFTIKRTLGNEKIVIFEILSRNNFPLVRNSYAFCEFTRIEKMIWPDLLKASNMPQNKPCPFPAVSKLLKHYIQIIFYFLST